MIHLDTSVLIDVLDTQGANAIELRELLLEGEVVTFSALVEFEWRRGPRTPEQISDIDRMCPEDERPSFGPAEARKAARLYAAISRPRGREIGICIAACAIVHGATLWTLNSDDFADIPGLRLI